MLSEECYMPAWFFWPIMIAVNALMLAPFFITSARAIVEKCKAIPEDEGFIQPDFIDPDCVPIKEDPSSLKRCSSGRCRWLATCFGCCCKDSIKKFTHTREEEVKG
jgi:hypothetical protein